MGSELCWDITEKAQLSTLYEVSASKPGNVNRFFDFEDTKFEHFLASSALFGRWAFKAAEIGQGISEGKDIRKINICELIEKAVETAKNFTGVNTNFGITMILIPLIVATSYFLHSAKKIENEALSDWLEKFIRNLNPENTASLYRAFRIAQPRLHPKETILEKKYSKFDIWNPHIFEIIEKERITPWELFSQTKELDRIAEEWVSGFKITIHASSFLKEIYKKTDDMNSSIVYTYLQILAEYPDTHIVKKVGQKKAEHISEKAKEIIQLGAVLTEKGKEEIVKFDKLLRDPENLLNPGTTADLVTGALFLLLL